MGAVLGKCMGQLDDKKLTMAIDKGFAFFDKDKSGFIEGPEATAAAQKALGFAGPIGKKVTPQMIDNAFSKIAGADHKIDKQEFGGAVRGLVEKVGGPKTTQHTTGTTGATPAAAPAAAAAAADTPAAATTAVA